MSEHAPQVRVGHVAQLPDALRGAGLDGDRVVVALVGGAGGMGEQDLRAVADVLLHGVVPVVARRDAVVVDGGTDSGVMRLIGRARAAAGARFPLVGVAAEGTVVLPGGTAPMPDAAPLEPNHTLFVLVPGGEWGDEAPWIGDVAGVVAGARASATLLVNGGEIAYADAAGSLQRGRPVVVLAGTGRTADAIAKARATGAGDPRAVEIAASALTTVADVAHPDAVSAALDAALDAARDGAGRSCDQGR
jgi:SLOG in TRPM, prokaryote